MQPRCSTGEGEPSPRINLPGVVASTSICFDLSVFEIFLPLATGGTIVLVDDLLHLDQSPATQNATLLNTVPSLISELITVRDLPDAIETVNLAGEYLTAELTNRLLEQNSTLKVNDLYGPSETTTYSTYVRRVLNGPETIGKPIHNTKIYICDEMLQPLPIGMSGQMFIGGLGVARGYLERSTGTAEKFLPDPFGPISGSRLYRTGDMARYHPDGNIEFMGRIDNQVKLRGFRIELGEVEEEIRKYDSVREAAVVMRRTNRGD